MVAGQQFTDVSEDDFIRINNEANTKGLRAFVTMIRETDNGKLISFFLKSRFNA